MYWTNVEQQLPEEGQRVQAKFLYYYKYADREAEARVDTDNFTYKNSTWISDEGIFRSSRNRWAVHWIV